ncbi:hypothetical protein DICSQDRAFT_137400 [Dichomitus squalens LYAD-421 SS1]|uniref:Uncharacterized protein n=1 Tax=Dichomitus squalens (strain LYAD-421) TaxID=732165 RepID=R7SX90_DICSQ|nr:uncharacterized protein DICSQDRAFT_137400 [Dichomitus squalens LYAD-421 SS1]EJF60573.1 hypothetical protein DICSQDRAFT_137400 [Dichomitus squalens LYAD-421 SS1]
MMERDGLDAYNGRGVEPPKAIGGHGSQRRRQCWAAAAIAARTKQGGIPDYSASTAGG